MAQKVKKEGTISIHSDGSKWIKKDKPAIGIRWQGNPAYDHDLHRSYPLKQVLDLFDGKDVDITIVTGALDQKLNEKGYIVPGLGDAGDTKG